MNKKTIIEKYFKYWKLESKYEFLYKILERSLSSKNINIKYKMKDRYYNPKNNIHWLSYISNEFEKYWQNYNFLHVNYKFTFTNTKFIDVYLIIDWKYYFKCFNIEETEAVSEYKELIKILNNKNK